MLDTPGEHRHRRARKMLRGARLVYGALLLATPDAMLGVAGRRHPDRSARGFARVLGARQLLEAALVGVEHPGRRIVGTAVDGIHALCALAFARRWPAQAHALHLNAVIAGMLAAAGEHVR